MLVDIASITYKHYYILHLYVENKTVINFIIKLYFPIISRSNYCSVEHNRAVVFKLPIHFTVI